MKLYRFMSSLECLKLLKGETLANSTDHSKKRGTASTAKGFCFGIGDKEQAKQDFRRLKGIVDLGALIVFTLKPESENRYTPCQGRYVDYTKIESDGKTIVDYPLGMEPSCMVDEFCAYSYSLEDFEDYRVYCTFVNANKDPSDKDFLVLREPGNTSEEFTADQDLNEGRKVALEIIELLQEQDVTPGQALIALGISTSIIIDAVVKHSDLTPHDCVDDFVGMLKTFVFPEGEKQ